jgi:hypothetical protein
VAVHRPDRRAPATRRWLGTFETEREAVDAERATRLGIAPSARTRKIRDCLMVWLHDSDGGALVQRLYGHPSERGMREQTRLAFSECAAERLQDDQRLPGNRGVSQ